MKNNTLKKILVLFSIFSFLKINSAELPDPEKDKLVEVSQKDYDDLEKIVINLAKGSELFLSSIDDITGPTFEYTIENLSLFSATNIVKTEDEDIITFTAALGDDGYLSCTYVKEDKSYICNERRKDTIYYSQNAKIDFNVIRALYEKQEK